MPSVNPEILFWARESAGLTIDDAAHRIGLSGAHAADHLSEMERGAREPTRRQLTQMAHVYHRSLVTFYLRERPRPGARNHDLRMMRESDVSEEAKLAALIRDVRAGQSILSSALEDSEEATPVPVVSSISLPVNSDDLADMMQLVLGIHIEEYRSKHTIEDAFAFLRTSVERLGVFVLLMGNLGSHHSNMGPQVFRGFSIAKPIAPFIVINENDAKSAWSFTLLHELAHVFLGQSDISGYGSSDATERLCDDAASIFLLRGSRLENFDVSDATAFEDLADRIGTLASKLKVSRTMIAYNLLRMQKISSSMYRRLAGRFDSFRLDFQRTDGNGGPNYYILRRHRVGRGLVQTMSRMLRSGVMTTPEASKVLRVKPTAVATLLSGQPTA